MTQIVQAVFEHGVFRPLEPVQLPENERVVLSVSDTIGQPSTDETTFAPASKDAIERQQQALARLRERMASLPCEAPHDGLGGADHDQILYGWQK